MQGLLHGRHRGDDRRHAAAAQLPRRSGAQSGVGGAAARGDGAHPGPSSTRRWTAIGVDVSLPCDEDGRPAVTAPPSAAAGPTTGRRSSPPCCCLSQRWRRRGAATRRPDGTASRPRPRAASTPCGCEAARAQGLAEAQTQVDVATFIQWVDASAHDDAELKDFYERALPRRVQARLRGVVGHRPADHRRRTADPVRDGRVPARGRRGGQSGSTPRRSARRHRSAATSSGRRTTCSASSCSPWRCSSPA